MSKYASPRKSSFAPPSIEGSHMPSVGARVGFCVWFNVVNFQERSANLIDDDSVSTARGK